MKRETSPVGGKRGKVIARSVPVYALLIVLGMIVLIPVYVAFMASFKPHWEIFTSPYKLPTSLFLDNYRSVLKIGIGRNMLNSIMVTGVSLVFILFIGSLSAYVFSRFNFFLKKLIFWVVISGLMIPVYGVVIPMYVFMDRLGLLSTYPAVILPYISFSLPFAIFVLRGYLSSIPRELDDAARIDGCSLWQTYWRIILPLSRPGIAAVLIFCGIGIWSELPFALVLLRGRDMMTLPPAMLLLANNWAVKWPEVLAVVCLAIGPIMVLYFLLAEHFIKGLTAGALKM